MNWARRVLVDSAIYSDRYVYLGDRLNEFTHASGLRVLMLRSPKQWSIRWAGSTDDRHLMPPETPLEEVQAVAVALWRMQ